DGSLSVTPVLLTVTGDAQNRPYGGSNPALTATITGFVNSEDASVLTAQPSCSTAADASSPVGGYAISCSGAAADNYTFSYTDGTLSVTQVQLTVTAPSASREQGTANPAFTPSITGFANSENSSALTTQPSC